MTNLNRKLTIAIDGHSSTGKSTVAKSLAKMLGYLYIDSGAMYRAVTLFCIDNNIIDAGNVNEQLLKQHLNNISINFTYDNSRQKYLTWLNNQMVEEKIRQLQVSDNVSAVSKIGFVRQKLVALQQQLGANGGIVMDGRDIGTVVFPNADLKIFMTASVNVRAQRRYDELVANGEQVDFELVKQNIEKRDFIDQNREISPLVKAHDAIVIDNSSITREQQLQMLLELVNSKLNNVQN